MICKNCGGGLTGNESVCPNCGNAVENNNSNNMGNGNVEPQIISSAPEVSSSPVNDGLNQSSQVSGVDTGFNQSSDVSTTDMNNTNTQIDNNTNINTNTQMNNSTPTNVGGNNNNAPKSGIGVTTIVLIVVLCVCIVGGVLYFTVFSGNSGTTSGGSKSGDANTTATSTDSSNKVSVSGYDLTLPDGYSSQTDDDFGFIIFNNRIAYTFEVDYTYTYEEYLQQLKAEYPDQANNMEVTIGGRKFIVATLYEEGKYATVYITKGDNVTFFGYIIRKDYKQVDTSDFTDLNKILDSAKQGASPFSKGDSGDAGKDGMVKFKFREFDNFDEEED